MKRLPRLTAWVTVATALVMAFRSLDPAWLVVAMLALNGMDEG